MQFPESWLREFCNPPISTEALAHTLTMAGLEVEDLTPVAPPFSGVCVGEIVAAEQHPNAQRLRVCQVNVGEAAPLTIVCGAPNARVGIRVPCARVGARLPPRAEQNADQAEVVIGVGQLRGVESFGMLCSAKELGISDESAGLLELPLDAPVGQDIRTYLQLDDTVFTLKLTPNLAHCLSVQGIAREVAALTGAPLHVPEIAPVAATAADARLGVRVDAPDLCGRFTGRVVRGVNAQATTPAWMVARLQRCGQRSVAPLVDISNYVMFEFGQPTHMFDLDRIQGDICVRWARAGESLKLLNGNTITMPEIPRVGVIADAAHIESLAGIMGGDVTAVSDDTRNIYIEAAHWHPDAIVGRARHFNFSTDAAHRFERGVDRNLTAAIVERITALVVQICGTPSTQVGPIDDQSPAQPQDRSVTMRIARASRVLGMPLTLAQCEDALDRLGLSVAREGSDEAPVLRVAVPSHRFDLVREEDVIEEVARILGYETLPTTKPLAPTAPRPMTETRRRPHALRRAVAALGYQETINFSFVPEAWERELAGRTDPVRLLNPIASHLNVMRSSLLGSLVQVLKFNIDRRASRVRVFEIGRVFWRDASVGDSHTTVASFAQPQRLAALAWGTAAPLQWGQEARRVDFYDVKGDLEALLAPRVASFEPPATSSDAHPALHPGRSARVMLDGQCIGHIGELHPRWVQQWELGTAPVVFELDLPPLLARPIPAFAPLSRQQSVERDLALVVAEGVPFEAVRAAAWTVAQSSQDAAAVRLRNITLFDVFRPDASKAQQASGGIAADEKSLAIRLALGSDAASPTDEQIDEAVAAIVQAIAQATGARLRT